MTSDSDRTLLAQTILDHDRDLLGHARVPVSTLIDPAIYYGRADAVLAAGFLPPAAEPAFIAVDEREKSCTDAWPECASGEYDPRCCRFPKSCSVDGRYGLVPRD